jgi:RNA polymerase sigma-70 factor (ECF subfamily)
MDKLSVEFREMLVLRHLEGLSYNEMAEITQLASGTIMSRLSRARDKLKESLGARLRANGR